MTGQPAQRPLLGITLIALAASCFATMDSASRYLGGFMPVLLFFWARYAFQAVAMGAWLSARGGRAAFATAQPRFQAVRGGYRVCEAPVTVCYHSRGTTKMKLLSDGWRILRPLVYLRLGMRL